MFYIIAIVCPPFAALIAGNRKQAGLNILLTFCGWVPGVIHALMVFKEAQKKNEILHSYEPAADNESTYILSRTV